MGIAVGFGSETFEFKSKYPHLHMPRYPVASTTLVTPTNAACLLDGEFVTLDADRKIVRGTISKQTPPTLNYWHFRGMKGRSDVQFGGGPIVVDEGYEFITRLHVASLTVGSSSVVKDALYTLANGNLTINGTAYTSKNYLLKAVNDDFYVAQALTAEDTDGWARFIVRRGLAKGI